MAVRSLSPGGRGGKCLREVPREGMIAGLIEEGGLLGGGFQKLLVLVVDIVAELNGLVSRHPRREINPGHRNFLRQMDALALAGRGARLYRAAAPFPRLLYQPCCEVGHGVYSR